MWTTIQTQIYEFLGTKTLGEMDFPEAVLKLIADYGPSYVNGAWLTIQIALIGTILGCLIGFLVGVVQTIPLSQKDPLAKRGIVRLIRMVLTAYVEFFRGTPMMMQAVFIYLFFLIQYALIKKKLILLLLIFFHLMFFSDLLP